jgi:hypothetical protein
MNTNKTVIINGIKQQINTSDILELTDKQQMKSWNEQRKKNYKKSISIKFGFLEKPVGDIIDTITKKTGLKWLITKLFKECGCEKRRQYFNKWNFYIPFVYIDNRLSLPEDWKTSELVTIDLKDSNHKEHKPLSRNLVRNPKRSCNCGAKNK